MEYENTSPIQTFFKNKWVRLVLAIDVIAVLVVIILGIFNSNKTSNIILNITPVDATISIDGKSDFINGTYTIIPGTHQLTISHEDLESKTFTINIAPDHATMVSTFLKGADGDLGFYTQKANYESYLRLTEIASAGDNITIDADSSAESFIADLEHTLSISKILPIKGWVYNTTLGITSSATAGFAIRDGINRQECEKIACLLVNYYGTDFQEAVMNKIKEAGYDPANYQFIYEKYN